MLLILAGLAVVVGSVIAGYMLEHGNLLVLVQPAELLIIVGGASGTILASCPPRNLRILYRSIVSIPSQRVYTPAAYLDALKLLYTLFQLGQGGRIGDLEPHMERPQQSQIFTKHPDVLADPVATDFICDSFRIAISAKLEGATVDRLMASDADIQRSGRYRPVRTLANVADSLPGLGIVAAVLGVVVTMQALNGPAAGIGQKVAAALVGTFLGILLCYGVISPLSSYMDCLNKAHAEYLQVLRVAITSFFLGDPPLVAAEAGRRSIPIDLRPSLDEMEKEVRRHNALRKRAAEKEQETEQEVA